MNQQCLDNIKRQPPPYNIPCTDSFCIQTRPIRDEHCFAHGLNPCTPVLSYDPEIGGPCYCCCPCPGLSMPIAVMGNEFALIQDLVDGDTILTADSDLNWQPGNIDSISNPIDPTMVSGLYLLQFEMESGTSKRDLFVTAGHMVMMADNTLKKAKDLRLGEDLRCADGTIAKVIFIQLGVFDLTIHTIEMEGEFDGQNLDGHLLNTNGIVSADFKVQAYYEAIE